MSPRPGPAELVMMAAVARHHYLEGESKVEIADRLGISRFKVARMLEAAREQGLVRIEISPADGLDLDTSAQLQERLGLTCCAVLAADPGQLEETTAALGRVAARLLAEILTPADVLGLPWSRSVLAMTAHLRDLPPVRVVQLSGAMEVPGMDASAVDIVRAAAKATGGSASIFHAPFVLDDIESAQAVRRQSSVAAGLAAAADVTHAVVGVGAWAPGSSTVYAAAGEATRATVAAAGVVGETAGVFFDADGAPVELPVTRRLVTVSGDRLHRIPHVVAIVTGADKAAAVRAAVHGGLVNGLVVDGALARALLEGGDAGDTSRMP